jgi:lipopolysaccharide export LptBFGC system permease protein LptF
MHKQKKVLIGGALLGCASVLLPWLSFGANRVYGWEMDGFIALILCLFTLVTAFSTPLKQPLKRSGVILSAIFGGLVIGLILYIWTNLAGVAGFDVMTHLGIGFWIMAVSGIIQVVGAVVLREE